ncbi:isochorismate-pyruvate lyase [Pseudomonas agarici]|uniref:chorismate mutase n=1 Tax=Pseudomonas agarici TaxID=46677 RepID=A0A0X1T668_PSEAA|nr:isochorismate lyase [Pseudomonas agarici]AMB87606.1 isochorismate-pyruvate lyase [Pseudomonas agarici]NWB89989.1 isochorismate lyase [Pseudomonas agarici]NWC08230.1 isochorismate lyase [Pseudomonas agarici]SEK83324.1 isochorismate pyruvate lyase [Pseudomonas agarici]
MNAIKPALQCANLQDIRQGIDHLDRQLVELLAARLTYVQAATRFKANLQAIPAPERVSAMLEERRLWAADAGLPVDETEEFFGDLIHWFINLQINHWHTLHLQEAQP